MQFRLQAAAAAAASLLFAGLVMMLVTALGHIIENTTCACCVRQLHVLCNVQLLSLTTIVVNNKDVAVHSNLVTGPLLVFCWLMALVLCRDEAH